MLSGFDLKTNCGSFFLRDLKMINKRIIFHEKPSYALNPQKKIDQHNFPFTLNPTIGCLFGCLYCYTQGFPFNQHTEFGKEVKVKLWLPARLDIELKKYQNLPQHLKRVQMNESTEGYLPAVMAEVKKKLGRDLLREVLEVFRKHWNNKNYWMIHLLTKSHMIVKHLDILAKMKNQVQVELTITTLNEKRRKILEGSAPSVKRRLDVIKKLSKAGVFVRVMCMPFIGTKKEAEELRRVCFDHGAKGFKHKSMNYWDENALLQGKLLKIKGRKDFVYDNLLVKSGEPVLKNGQSEMMDVIMSTKKKDNQARKSMPFENSGYAEMNNINWGYLL
jgi:DNA repair photolyase